MKGQSMTTNSHFHDGRIWEIFPCRLPCDGVELGDPEMDDHWLNGWIFEAFNFVIINFMIYVCGIDEPAFKIYFDDKHD
jgi:hypothetical protein